MTQRTLYRQLRAVRDHFTPPPGFTWPEISAGRLVPTPARSPRHQLTAALLTRRLDPQLPSGFHTFGPTDTEDETLRTLRVPDLVVCSAAAMDTDDPLDPREIVLAMEIVCPSNPENDYEHKTRDYPAMGIPHYLILDPRDATWTYQWGFGGGEFGYRNRLRMPYGEPVAVATHLGTWTVETADLPTTPTPAAS
ncbi:Uma2 family endonuclease [Streptomyces sp. S6]